MPDSNEPDTLVLSQIKGCWFQLKSYQMVLHTSALDWHFHKLLMMNKFKHAVGECCRLVGMGSISTCTGMLLSKKYLLPMMLVKLPIVLVNN